MHVYLYKYTFVIHKNIKRHKIFTKKYIIIIKEFDLVENQLNLFPLY